MRGVAAIARAAVEGDVTLVIANRRSHFTTPLQEAITLYLSNSLNSTHSLLLLCLLPSQDIAALDVRKSHKQHLGSKHRELTSA